MPGRKRKARQKIIYNDDDSSIGEDDFSSKKKKIETIGNEKEENDEEVEETTSSDKKDEDYKPSDDEEDEPSDEENASKKKNKKEEKKKKDKPSDDEEDEPSDEENTPKKKKRKKKPLIAEREKTPPKKTKKTVNFFKEFHVDLEDFLGKINLEEEKITGEAYEEKLKYLDITIENSIDNDTHHMQGVEKFREQLKNIVNSGATDDSIQNLLDIITKEEGELDIIAKEGALEQLVKALTILRAKWCLFPLLFPNLTLSHCSLKSSELELTSKLFSSFCNISDLFKGTNTNAGVAINNYITATVFTDNKLNNKLAKLMPDRYVTFPTKGLSILRILQEDKPDRLTSNEHHPDEIKLITLLRIAHSKTIREILTDNGDVSFYNNIYTYGILSCSNRVELMGIKCNIEKKDGKFSLQYNLVKFGTFNITNGSIYEVSTDQCINLASNILTLLVNCSKQQKTILNNLKEFGKSKNIGTTTKIIEPLFKIGEIIQLKFNRVLKSAKILNVIDKKLARVQIENEILFVKDGISNFPVESLIFEGFVKTNSINYPVEITLAGDCLEDIKSFTKESLLNTITQLLIELRAIHEKYKTIHNDIKPLNIIRYFNEYSIFIDFEISRSFTKYDETNQICYDNNNSKISCKSGTNGYLPPEKQESGSGYITPMSDIYSLGKTFNELISKTSNLPEDIRSILDKLIKKMTSDITSQRVSANICIKYLISTKLISIELCNDSKTRKNVYAQVEQKMKDLFTAELNQDSESSPELSVELDSESLFELE